MLPHLLLSLTSSDSLLTPQITQEKNSPFVRLSVLMFLAFWPSHSLVFLFFGLLWEWLLRYKHTRKYAWRFRYFLQGVKTIDGKPIPGSPGALSRNLTVGGHVWGSQSLNLTSLCPLPPLPLRSIIFSDTFHQHCSKKPL